MRRRLAPFLAAILVMALFLGIAFVRDPVFWRNWLAASTHLLAPLPAARVAVAGAADERIPTPKPGHAAFPAAALNAAGDYAARNHLAALLVVYDDELVLETYGAGLSRETRLDAGRMQDILLSLLTGIAVNSGALPSVQARLDTLAPGAGPVTIQQLLAGTAGLPAVGNPANPASLAARLAFSGKASQVALNASRRARPGQPDMDNPLDAQLLVLALRSVFSQPFGAILSGRLWTPMGGMAAELTLERPGGVARGDGGFYARPLDWAKLGNLLTSSGSVGGKEIAPLAWINQMVRPSGSDPARGLMVELARPGEFPADDLYFANGGAGQRLIVVPSRALAIVEFGRPKGVDPAELPKLLLAE